MKFYSVENEQPTERTLRQEANRLEHLRAKAAKQKKYSPASWFSVIFSYRGRAAHHIRHPLAWVLLVSVVAALVSTSHGTRKWTAWLKRVEAAEALLRMALSFLLVFRLGRSATRYWEARQKAGAMIEVCRTLASTALAHMVVGGDLDRVEHRLRWPASPRAARDEAKDEPWMSTSCSPASAVCRWIVVFPVAAKNYLRADPGDAAEALPRRRRAPPPRGRERRVRAARQGMREPHAPRRVRRRHRGQRRPDRAPLRDDGPAAPRARRRVVSCGVKRERSRSSSEAWARLFASSLEADLGRALYGVGDKSCSALVEEAAKSRARWSLRACSS